MPRPIRAVIHRAALRHNLALARRQAAGRFVWAVVKSNAYGHGLDNALPAFADADGIALLDLDEAQRARAAGWRKPIVLLEGAFEAADWAVVDRLRLTAVVHHDDQIAMLEALRPTLGPIEVVLKVDSGMTRLGFARGRARRALERLEQMPGVRVNAAMTHLANADRADPSAEPVSLNGQVSAFETALAGWPGARSIANSAALFLHDATLGDSVRPGIALYGGTPVTGTPASAFDLRPAMTLVSRVLSVQDVDAGRGVGYGSRWIARRSSRIGVVACGYADGYPRHAPDGTPVRVGDVDVPLAGRVSMDMLTVDLTEAPQARAGDPVELWGRAVPIDTVAELAGTVGYELMCALARRVPVRIED